MLILFEYECNIKIGGKYITCRLSLLLTVLVFIPQQQLARPQDVR